MRAYGGPQLQLIQDVMTKLASAIETSGVPIVPQTVVSFGDGDHADGNGNGNGGGGGSNNAFGLLMGLMATERLGELTRAAAPADSEQAKSVAQLKKQIMRDAGAAGMVVGSAAAAPSVRTPRPKSAPPTGAQAPVRPPAPKPEPTAPSDSAGEASEGTPKG